MLRFLASSRVRLGTVAGTAAIALGLVVPIASADKPVRIPPGPVDDATLPDSCAFPVVLHTDTNKGVTTIFADGRILVTGAVKVTLTNANDPTKSVTLNIPGPGTFTTDPSGGPLLTARGPWIFIFSPGNLGPGAPGALIYTTGKATLLGNPDGTQTFTHDHGTTTDLCALLA